MGYVKLNEKYMFTVTLPQADIFFEIAKENQIY
jgi:hypothetical protein